MRGKMETIAGELGSRRMPASAEPAPRRRSSCAGPPTTTSPSLATANTRSASARASACSPRCRAPSLGIMRGHDAEAKPRPLKGLAAAGLKPGASIDPLILTKTNARSTVHRPGYMDYIGVLCFDEAGNAIAEQRFLGLYTSSAYNRRPWDIPLVRQRHAGVMAASGLGETSHSGKALRHILETLPRDELFQSGTEELTAHRDGHPRPAGARTYAPVPAPRPPWPLLFRAGLHPARPLQRRRARAHRGDADARAQGRAPRHLRADRRKPAGAAAPADPPARAARACSVDPARSKPNWCTSCATGRTSCATTWCRCTAKSRASASRSRFGKALAGRLRRIHFARTGGHRHRRGAALSGEHDLHRSLYHAADGGCASS